MLGGGNFTIQNKVFPGAYINFVSTASAGASMGSRGVAAIPMVLEWGPEKKVFEVTAEDFRKRCKEIFGYAMNDAAMLPVRELFRNMTKGIFYRLNAGVHGANDYGTAKYSGIRGNSLMTIISKNVDDPSKFDVKTLLAGREIDCQTITEAGELKDNSYVIFKKEAALAETAGLPFTGGTNGADVTGEDYAEFLEKMENASFQILCCPSADDNVKALFTAFTKRMRDEAGVKFQTVLHQYSKADYEGVISVENEAEESAAGLVYWAAGAEAACAVNKTIENKVYDGEYTVKTSYTQAQLADAIKAGKLMLHKVGSEIRVLTDSNTLVTYTEEKGEDFSNNQTVRVLDQIGNDIASLFHTRYLGKISNDDAGRVSLWNDIVTYGKQLAVLGAIEAVNSEEVTVEKGQDKRSVVVNLPVKPINSMSILYMTVVVS
ncbi:phage tail sheath subtilisin-like domain-containing protein [Lacrimispora indolis]|uniref:phage tail sheath subtilisin-like domain-containing protein n=1 Tax=Lacrimispora indolis TaxID=69825 RepID=UPI000423BEDC|nr:phage tail sheath subtilisin-like domain-containing protein [[Clostridium] methoxybenzovorans]